MNFYERFKGFHLGKSASRHLFRLGGFRHFRFDIHVIMSDQFDLVVVVLESSSACFLFVLLYHHK